jgi:negative regulator of flagellin synthesis FlgM
VIHVTAANLKWRVVLGEFVKVHPNPDDNSAWAYCLPQEISVSDKISGISTAEPVAKPTGSGSSVVADKSQGEGSAAAATAQTGDHVTLTDSARSLQKIEEAVAKTPVVNAHKVAAVKQAISSGTYKIDAGRIAGKILKYESGLK